jgi:hypothetical protein
MASIDVRTSPADEAGHESVAGARAEVHPDVGGGCDGVEQHPGDDERDACGQRGRRRQHGQRAVQGQPDHHHVADRAGARHLPQWDPAQQDDGADHDRRGPHRPVEMAGQPLVQHVPRRDTERRPDEQGHRCAVQRQAGVELDEPAGQAASSERGQARR